MASEYEQIFEVSSMGRMYRKSLLCLPITWKMKAAARWMWNNWSRPEILCLLLQWNGPDAHVGRKNRVGEGIRC